MGEASPTQRYSASPSLLGSSDSSLIKESEDLLSKFMRGPSQESQDDHLHPQSTSNSAIARASPKGRVKIPRGNVQLRPESIPRPQASSTKSSATFRPKIKQTVVLPTERLKPQPQTRRTLPRPDSDAPHKPAVARRSGRPRVEPTNYFKKLSLFASESEDETPDVPGVSSPKSLLQHRPSAAPAPALPVPTKRNIRPQDISYGSLLRQRELGSSSNQWLRARVTPNLRATKIWKGASNDVVSLAWSPDGTRFAAGATAQCDEHMMAYNRRNNLLVGDLVSDELHELPDHWVQRPKGRDPASYVVDDCRLFMSVTAVEWFERTLYTASYDHTVKLWDTRNATPSCSKTLRHGSKVIVMARSAITANLLATGAQTIGFWDVENDHYTALELPHARSRKDTELIPTSLAWGINQATKEYLLAGMSEKEDNGVVAQHGLLAGFRFGESSVVTDSFWPKSQNVFDVAWHPFLPTFAAACTAGQQASRGTRSVVNLYDPLRFKSRVLELECPALDMNEVTFCPTRSDYVSASCTDGRTYVWDRRNCSKALHTLKHGDPLNQLDETMEKEQADTGVNLQVWGSTFDQFYTGASDGMLKRWNILLAPEDVLVEDVASLQEGIMCGAFSPDQTNLLVGDVSGGVHLLSSSPFSPERHGFVFRETPHVAEQDNSESGIRAARELVSSGQIERHPVFGPGKGPEYKGPFAAWARPDGTPLEHLAVTKLTEKYEARQISGVPPRNRRPLTQAMQREVEGHIILASIRNKIQGQGKRRIPVITQETLDLCSDDEVAIQHRRPRTKAKISQPVIIDLTGDSDAESAERFASFDTHHKEISTARASKDQLDDLDEDFWWPDSGTIDPNFADD
ncbi:hypothetical protein BDV12DRAFT_62557 [Aspergillus spectabilis]